MYIMPPSVKAAFIFNTSVPNDTEAALYIIQM